MYVGPGNRFDDATRLLIDVDSTMAHDVGDVSATAPAPWNPGDELLFTIDPLVDGTVLDAITGAVLGAAQPIDGGEIMHLIKAAPGTFAISFISYGGHLWDTAFDVRGTFGYFYEDVDALEAVGTLTGDTDIPTPIQPACCCSSWASRQCLRYAAAAERTKVGEPNKLPAPLPVGGSASGRSPNFAPNMLGAFQAIATSCRMTDNMPSPSPHVKFIAASLTFGRRPF